MARKWIIAFIDFFYPPFSKVMPLQTFRYAACGGTNTLVDIFVFFITYNFILHQQNVSIGFMTLKPYVASFLISFCVSFPLGFFLMSKVVFTQSTLHGRVQLFRYFMLVMVCLGLNYFFLRLFVEQFHLYATVAKIITTFIVATFSYLAQKNFTFKAATEETEQVD